MSDSLPPVSEAMFYILIALAEPRHGYAVAQQAEKISAGRVSIGPGTLYGALTTLTERGWIARASSESGNRRKTFRLTKTGAAALGEQISRLEEMVEHGQQALALIGKAD